MTPSNEEMAGTSSDERSARLATAFSDVRRFTEALAAPLSAEDQTVQSMPDVSPTKWHRGHTTWFFETFLLLPELAGYQPLDPAYAYLFNSYYEALGARHPRPERGLLSRPGIAEVAAYRDHVDRAMEALLGSGRAPSAEVLDLVELGVNHEQQHQELLLMDIKHVLSRNPLRPAYASADTQASPPASPEQRKVGWVEHPGGQVEVGHCGPTFSFDNESPRHRVELVPFALADRLVSCGDWLEFMDDGGYTRPELWLSEGWATIQDRGWDAPLYWEREVPHTAGRTDLEIFTLFGPRHVEPSSPVVHVSYFEADAFARWSGARLPTEAEWEAVAAGSAAASDDPRTAPSGFHPGEGTGLGLYGTAWQWTSSSYSPYPGFRPAAGAVGEYNGKFMVNQQVLRGSACVTPPGHARCTYRNFFPAAARWAFSGLRLARDL